MANTTDATATADREPACKRRLAGNKPGDEEVEMSGEDDADTEPSQPPTPRTLKAEKKRFKEMKLMAKMAGKSAVKEMVVVLEPRLQAMEAANEAVVTRVAKLEASPTTSVASGSSFGGCGS